MTMLSLRFFAQSLAAKNYRPDVDIGLKCGEMTQETKKSFHLSGFCKFTTIKNIPQMRSSRGQFTSIGKRLGNGPKEKVYKSLPHPQLVIFTAL